MAIFEKIGNAIASGVSGTASKAKDLGELQKLNSELSTKKKELNALYAQIGKTCVESTDMEKIGELKNKAVALIAEIDALGDKINDNKGQTHKENYIERQYTDDEIQSIFGDIENFENLDI